MIYLVQIERSDMHSMDIFPLGPLQVGSALENVGFPVKIIHIEETDIDQTVTDIAREKPLWVGLSVMTGPQTEDSVLFSEKLKEVDPSIPIVWGGIHPSLISQQCMSENYIDFVIMGEGEETAIELTQTLDCPKKDFSKILGLAYKENGIPQENAKRPFIQNLDDDRYQIRFELLDVESYFGRVTEAGCSRILSYKTSRGCPWPCAFCYVQEFHNRKYRAKSPEKVIEDIQYLKDRYHIDGVIFYDDEFYVRRKRAMQIIEGIGIPAKTDIRIDNNLDEPLVAWLTERQVFDMLIGIESGSDRMLKYMQKGFNLETIHRGVKLLAKYDVKVSYSAIIGLPTETREEMNETVDLCLWIHERHEHKTFTVGPLLPYPGAPLYYEAIKHGFVPPTTTKGWGRLDRWSAELRLPWCTDEYVNRVREYLKFFDYRVPLLDWVAENRLRRRFVSVPIDVKIVNFIWNHAVEGKTLLSKLIRRAHRFLKRKSPRPSTLVASSEVARPVAG